MTPLVGGGPQRDARDVLSSVNTRGTGIKDAGRMGLVSTMVCVSSENSQAAVVHWMRAEPCDYVGAVVKGGGVSEGAYAAPLTLDSHATA